MTTAQIRPLAAEGMYHRGRNEIRSSPDVVWGYVTVRNLGAGKRERHGDQEGDGVVGGGGKRKMLFAMLVIRNVKC